MFQGLGNEAREERRVLLRTTSNKKQKRWMKTLSGMTRRGRLNSRLMMRGFESRWGNHLGGLIICPSGIRFRCLQKQRTMEQNMMGVCGGGEDIVAVDHGLSLGNYQAMSTESANKIFSLGALEVILFYRQRDMVGLDGAFRWIVGHSRLRWPVPG